MRGPARVHVGAVVDVVVDDETQADRIFTLVLAALNAKASEYGAVHYASLYLRDERKATLMIRADAPFIGAGLVLVHVTAPTFHDTRGGRE